MSSGLYEVAARATKRVNPTVSRVTPVANNGNRRATRPRVTRGVQQTMRIPAMATDSWSRRLEGILRGGRSLAACAVPSCGILILVSLLILSPSFADTVAAADLSREIRVSWDFGSGPGKASNFYVGDRMIKVRYDSPDCLSRFTLEQARFEFSQVEKNGRSVPEGPAFIMLTFRKHFVGDFKLLPRVTIAQNEANREGKPTGRKVKVVFPFREKKMAAPVADWNAADIDVHLEAPGAVMDLHNPFDWFDIEIRCE